MFSYCCLVKSEVRACGAGHRQAVHWLFWDGICFPGYRMCICHLSCLPVKPNLVGGQVKMLNHRNSCYCAKWGSWVTEGNSEICLVAKYILLLCVWCQKPVGAGCVMEPLGSCMWLYLSRCGEQLPRSALAIDSGILSALEVTDRWLLICLCSVLLQPCFMSSETM